MFEEENELEPWLTPYDQQPTEVDPVAEHNLRQQANADFLSSLTGIPSGAIGSVASFAKSATDMISGIAKVPGQLAFTLGEMFDPELAAQMKENPEVRKAVYEMASNTLWTTAGPTNIGGLEDASEDLGELMVQDEDGGVTENIAKGDYGDAAVQLSQQVAGAIPSVLATMTGPGGLAAIGLSSLGNNYEETMDAHPTESSMKILGTSLVKAGGEVASEYVTQKIGAKALQLLRNGVPPEAVKQTLGRSVRNIFKDFNNEGLSEAAAELLNNGVDNLAYGEEFGTPEMWYQLADSYLVGGIMGGGMSTIGEANTYTRNSVLDGVPTKDNKEYQIEREAAINAIHGESKNAQSPEAIEANEKAVAELKGELAKNIEEQHQVWDNMSQEETNTYLQLKKDAEGFMKAAQGAATPEAAQVLEAKANQKIEEADKLYETVENWDGLRSQADRIEAANRAAEVANPEAVQDHVYGLRPTSTDAINRTNQQKVNKDLELSVSKIDNNLESKLKELESRAERQAADYDVDISPKNFEGAQFRGRLKYYKDKNDEKSYQETLKAIDAAIAKPEGEKVDRGVLQVPTSTTVKVPVMDNLTGEPITDADIAATEEAQKAIEKRFKQAQERAKAQKKMDAQLLSEQRKRVKDQATAEKEKAKIDSQNKNDIAAIQQRQLEGRTLEGSQAMQSLLKRNKPYIDWATRQAWNWYKAPKTMEELGGVEIAQDLTQFRGTRGVQRGPEFDGVRDLVIQEAMKNIETFNPEAGVQAATHVFGTNKLVQKVKQEINKEGKVKPAVGRGKSVVYHKQALADLKDSVKELIAERDADPESAYLYNDMIKSYENEIYALENVMPYTYDVDKGFGQEGVKGVDAESAGEASYSQNFEAIDSILGFSPKESAQMLNMVKEVLESGAMPSMSSMIADANIDQANSGNTQADADLGAREGRALDEAQIQFADKVRTSNPKLRDLVNSYVNDMFRTPENIEENAVTIFNLLPRTITGKNSKAFKGFFNGVRGNKEAGMLPWGEEFKGLKTKHTQTKKLRDAVSNSVVDAMIDTVIESNPSIELSLDPVANMEAMQDNKPVSVMPIVRWMNGMTSKTGQRVVVNDNVVDQVQETLPKGSRLNGFINKNSGEIYVRGTVKPKTVIHEMGHAWAATAKAFRPELYKQGAKLALDSEYADIVRNNYPGIEKDKARFEEEVLAHAIEAKGEAITNKYAKSKFEQWVDKFFDAVLSTLGIKAKNPSSLTYDEFMTLASAEILTGRGLAGNAARQIGQKTKTSAPEYSVQPAFKLSDAVFSNPKVAEALSNPEWVEVPSGAKAATKAQAVATARSFSDVMNFLPKDGRAVFAKMIKPGFKKDPMVANAIEGLGESLATSNHEGTFGKDVDWQMAMEPARGNKNRIANNQKAMKAIFQGINEGVNSGRIGQAELYNMKLIMNNSMGSMLRDLAQPKFWHRSADQKKGSQSGFIREHVMPANQFFNEALEAANNDSSWNELMDNYQIVVIAKADDAKLRKTGIPRPYFNNNFKIGGLPKIYSRYFNGEAMIDPTQYVDANGNTMAKIMGIRPEGIEAIKKHGIEGIEFSVDTNANNQNAENAEAAKKLRNRKIKKIQDALNLKGKSVLKSQSPYKISKVTPETREILDRFKRQFAHNKTVMTDKQLDEALENVNQIVKNGTNDQQAIRAKYKQQSEARKASVAELLKNTEGIDVNNLTPVEADQIAKGKDSFLNRVSLAPDANNDFYGLLYNLFGKNQQNREWFENELIKPLEFANLSYIKDKQEMLASFDSITNRVDGLTKKSGIKIKGAEITNDQAVRIFNHIKNPHLWDQMNEGGIDQKKMEEIVDYINSKPDLRTYSDQLVGIYSKFLTKLNPEMAKHNYKTIGTIGMPVDEGNINMLNKIFGKGNIPETAPYTPFTAQGTEDYVTLENLSSEGGDYYSVMSGNLKRRTGGGKYTFADKTNASDFKRYLSGPVRTKNYLDFAKNASDIFSSKNLRGMDAAFGKEWGISMRDSLKRIVTGQSGAKQGSAERSIQKFFNGTVAGIMFLNTRSAMLQLLSTGNYLVENPAAFIKGLGSGYGKAFKTITNSNWMKERGSGRTQLETEELFQSDSKDPFVQARNWVLEKGYALTKAGDRAAIALGGAAFINGLIKQGVHPGEAFRRFVAQTEETQQSTRQERLGRQQTSTLGRTVLAFANTPMQYNRRSWKAIKDIRAGKNVGGNMGKVAYYLAAQNAAFTAAQQLLFASLDLEDDDERDKVLGGVNSMLDTVLRGSGIYGALAATAKNVLKAKMTASKGRENEKVYEAIMNTIPGLGTKVRQLKNTFQKPYYAQSQSDLGGYEVYPDVTVSQIANGVSFATNAPVWRMLSKAEAIADAFADDLENWQKIMRVSGYNRYTLGVDASSGFGGGFGGSFGGSFGDSPFKALKDGEMGQAHRDGTIEVDPNLSPLQRDKTIAHEMQHIEDMKTKGLDYDDNFVYYEGKKHARKNGMIKYNGKWKKEGHSDFPWEARAEKAEAKVKSPLKNTDKNYRQRLQEREAKAKKKYGDDYYLDPNYMDYKRKQSLLDLQAPEDDIYAERAKQDYTNWELDPETQRRWAESETGVDPNRVNQAVHRVQMTPLTIDDERVESQGLYNPYKDEAYVSSGAGLDTGVHELTHAGGLDAPRGAHALDIMGAVSVKDGFGNVVEGTSDYVNNPQEVGAFIMQLRHQIGAKPGQKITKDMLKNINTSGNEVDNMLLRAARDSGKEDKLIEAMNTVAAVEKPKGRRKKSLKELYSSDNTGLT